MPLFSAFTGFGFLEFSSGAPLPEKIFDAMLDSAGRANISESFDSLVQAEIYADAIAFASAQLTAERAGQQFRPRKAIDLLPKLEWEFGIVPPASATIVERQAEVIVAAQIARGARKENVDRVLRELLGSDFIVYLSTPSASAVSSSADPSLDGNWVLPGTPAIVASITEAISTLSVPLVCTYTRVAGDVHPLLTGMTALVGAGDYGRAEKITITAATSTTFTAAFAHPHPHGTVLTTGRTPNLASSKRINLVVLKSAAARDAETRRKVDRVMAKLLRGVSTWGIAEEVSPGHAGPFLVGSSPLGATPIAAVSYFHATLAVPPPATGAFDASFDASFA